MSKKVPVLIADFETIVVHDTKDMTIEEIKANYSTRVWQAAFSNLDKDDHIVYANNIDEFMYKIMTYGAQGGANIFFHNLGGFDGAFIWDWALKNDYKYVHDKSYSTANKRIVGELDRFTIFKNDKVFNFYDTVDMIKSSIDSMSKAIAEDTGTDEIKGITPLYTEEELAARTTEQIAYDDWYIKLDVETLKYVVKKYMIAECVDHKIYTQSNLAQQALDLDYEGFEEWYENTHGQKFDGTDLDLRDLIPYRRNEKIVPFTNHLKAKPIKKVKNKEVYHKQDGWIVNKNKELKPKYVEIDKTEYKEIQKDLPKSEKNKKQFSDMNWLKKEENQIIKSPVKLNGIKDDIGKMIALINYKNKYNTGEIDKTDYDKATKKLNQIMMKDQAIQNNKYGKHAFKGGFNFVNPIYQGIKLPLVTVYDINSMYPWILRTMHLPKAQGKFVKIRNINDLDPNKLYIIRFNKLDMTVKEDWVPFIKYRTNETTESGISNDVNHTSTKFGVISQAEYYLNHCELKDIYLTSAEVQLMKQAYNIHDYEIKNVKEYERDFELEDKMHKHVDFWMKVKRNANSELVRNYAKMMLNAVYGKLGNFDTEYEQYKYELSDEGVVEKLLLEDKQKPIRAQANVTAAAFITAYGRCYLAEMINKIGVENFVYCDTDSLHLIGHDEYDEIEIHKTKLGAFKIEVYEKDALYIKCKTYGSLSSKKKDGEYEFKCAAAGIHAKPNKEDFKTGNYIYDKKNIRVNGGILLIDQKQNIGIINTNYLYYQALYRNDKTSKKLVSKLDNLYDNFYKLYQKAKGCSDQKIQHLKEGQRNTPTKINQEVTISQLYKQIEKLSTKLENIK